jgi:S-adenosylmethionine-diacylgycerolhomoserine-N-methlytransferase
MNMPADHAGLMDRVYRHQRHIYDATRKFYLLGRDPMIAALDPPRGGAVLEIGCGTGRNLVKAAGLYPQSEFYGIDISSEMLTSAGRAIALAGATRRIRVARADAASFDPEKVFRKPAFDRIFVSYAVSMIPQWRAVLANAASRLAPNGELHVVDFGDLAGLPRFCRVALYRWLAWHHVTPRGTLFHAMADVAALHGGRPVEHRLHRGLAWHAVLRMPA